MRFVHILNTSCPLISHISPTHLKEIDIPQTSEFTKFNNNEFLLCSHHRMSPGNEWQRTKRLKIIFLYCFSNSQILALDAISMPFSAHTILAFHLKEFSFRHFLIWLFLSILQPKVSVKKYFLPFRVLSFSIHFCVFFLLRFRCCLPPSSWFRLLWRQYRKEF